MKKFYLTFVISICFTFAFATDFPSDSRTPKSLFGQKIFNSDNSLDKNFESGITFENVATVQACEFGKSILVIEKSDSLNSFPSVLGNVLILLHDNGFQTIYGNLQEIESLYKKETFFKAEKIGKTILNKNANPKPLIFKVIDINEKSKNFVNPLLFLPEITDTQAPKINSAFLQDSAGKLIKLSSRSNLPSGKYKVFVACFDTINNSKNQLVPFEINTSLNGNILSSISFQTLEIKNGKTQTSESVDIEKIYQHNGLYYLCEFELKYGSTTLAIKVRDYYKNISEQVFEISAF